MKRPARFGFFVAVFMAVLSAAAFGQSNEVALTVGGDFASNQNVSVSKTWAIEGSIAHRLAHVPLIGLYAELPVAAGFNSRPHLSSLSTTAATYSSLFVTPGLKLKISAPMVSPYFIVGGGVGHFSASSAYGSSTTATVSYGGGVDMTLLPFIGLRGEVRDYNSGFPAFGLGGSGRQHNLFVTGGLVLRF